MVFDEVSRLISFYVIEIFEKPFLAAFASYQFILCGSCIVDSDVIPHLSYILFFSFLLIFNTLKKGEKKLLLVSLIHAFSFALIKFVEFRYLSLWFLFVVLLSFLTTSVILINDYMSDSVNILGKVPSSITRVLGMTVFLSSFLFFMLFRPDISINHMKGPLISPAFNWRNFYTVESSSNSVFALFLFISNCFVTLISLACIYFEIKRNPNEKSMVLLNKLLNGMHTIKKTFFR